jgi:hypothetical protein
MSKMAETAQVSKKIGDPNQRFLYVDDSEESQRAKKFMDDLGIAYLCCNLTGDVVRETLPYLSYGAIAPFFGLDSIRMYWRAWLLDLSMSAEEGEILEKRIKELLPEE